MTLSDFLDIGGTKKRQVSQPASDQNLQNRNGLGAHSERGGHSGQGSLRGKRNDRMADFSLDDEFNRSGAVDKKNTDSQRNFAEGYRKSGVSANAEKGKYSNNRSLSKA